MPKIANHKRFTISFPRSMETELENILVDLKISRSELIRRALSEYMKKYKKQKLEHIAKMMRQEYATDKDLTVLTGLDGEDFQ
ncbi:MAG: ribbon-helix-helix domain-containing protein [Calditrichaeota bacterium]|nr:ribbon-helix-helix domain-containing protein [Calditrichota bacterium]